MGFFKKLIRPLDKVSSGLQKAKKLNILGAEAVGKIATLDFGGALNKGSKALEVVGLSPEAQQEPAVLDLSTPDAKLIEEQNKKKLLAASRLNSPGILSQSVLNLK